ncbi:MAG: thioredoxin domain-containing protein [Verrucomicrobiota bacterium JB024]|nr:thioredoxin domain-containing protein [Verrucomicrobiota bacterium JB024]
MDRMRKNRNMSKPCRHKHARTTGTVICAGLTISLLSALEGRIPVVAAFCGWLGDGCRETARYDLLGLPIAPLGIIYYAFLGLLCLRMPSWRFWTVMPGVGFELVLVKTMVEDHFFCVFCAANFLLIIMLCLLHFDWSRRWQMLAMILLAYVAGGLLINNGQGKTPADAQGQSPESVLATVGDDVITVTDVERPLVSPLHKLRQEIYQMQNAVLQTRVNDLLLEQEARDKGLSFDQLVAKIRGQIPPPTPRMLDHYYETGLYRMWGNWDGPEQEVKTKIREYLHNRDTNQLLLDHCQQLREVYPVAIFLKEPPLPLTRVRVGDAPSLGPTNASVTVIEFSDYLCPACRKGHEVVRQIREKYKANIRWVFMDYPLDRHPGARELALAARAAEEQGKFWEYQELLFTRSPKPTPSEATAYAEELGLDPVRFQQSLADPALAKGLQASISEAREAGVSSTPTFIINGRMRTGTPSFEEFSKLIDQALAEAATNIRKEPTPEGHNTPKDSSDHQR